MNRWYRIVAIAAGVAAIAVAFRTCQSSRQTLEALRNQEEATANAEPELTLREVTLEQPDDNGQLLWRVTAKQATYSPDRRLASLVKPQGTLYQDGEAIYEVEADRGEVREDGDTIFLEGNIVANSPRNELTLRGNSLEWIPEEDLLRVQDSIEGEHPQLNATAAEARLYNREGRLELDGQVVANTRAEPWLGLQTERLVWLLEEERLETDTPLKVDQYETEASQVVTGTLTGQQGEYQLSEQLVKLQDQVRLVSATIPLQASSARASWNVVAGTVDIDSNVRLRQPRRQILATANRARLNLTERIALLQGNVQAARESKQERLRADQLRWNLNSQDIEGNGNVVYQQPDPAATISGDRAVGNLEKQTVVVTGRDVVTEIAP